jgi:cation/acetate symporter
MIAGFGITLLYLVVTRYYPQFGIEYLGMYSNVNATTGAPLVDIAKVAADPAVWNVSPVPATHPLASKVGWFSINNISSGLFGVPIGFLTIWIVSLLTPAPSPRIQELLDDIRKPRGETYLKEKTA